MAIEDSFRIYTTSPLFYAERPFIVTTVNLVAVTVPRADWHLAIPNATAPLITGRFNFDYDGAYYPGMSSDLLHSLLFEDALLSLRRHLQAKLGNENPLVEDIQCRPEDVSLFMRYHLRGVFGEAMNALYNDARHADIRTTLRELLTLQPPNIHRPEI